MDTATQRGMIPYTGSDYDQTTISKFNVFQNFTKNDYHSTRRLFQKNTAAFWHKISYGFEKRIQLFLEALDYDADKRAFKRNFGYTGDIFQGGFFCYLLSPNGRFVIGGELFVTDRSVCFYGKKKTGGQNLDLHLRIPFHEIKLVVKAGLIRFRGFPSIVPIAEGINPKIIQIYGADGKVHQLGGFGPAFDKVFRLITTLGRIRPSVQLVEND